jgi:glycosyltransferase involved in cell wall biosynthesis
LKKVLIVANLFYASPRIPGLAKYLPEFGWQPIILTTPLGEHTDERFGPPNDFKKRHRVIETLGYVSQKDAAFRTKERLNLSSKKSYQYFRPLFRLLYRRYLEAVQYPDAEKKWKHFAVKAGNELLQSEDIDAIISSSSPVTSHLIAKELKERNQVPWVADLRDLWTQNHDYPYSKLRKLLEKRLEIRTLSSADALVTVTQPWAKKLGMLHKREVYTITNGFDPDKMSNGKANLTSKFTVTYTGQIYSARGKQDPSKLLAALNDLVLDRTINPKDVEVRFYGPENGLLASKIAEYGLSTIVRQCGIVPREISFEKQRESQVLLLLKWEDPLERGWHSLKIFEYLAAKRPTFAIGGAADAITELLNETTAGIDAQTVEDIKNSLRKLYNEYKLKGKISYQGNAKEINKYSYREMARKFAEVINNVTTF